MRSGLKVITAKQGFWNWHEKKGQEWQRYKELFNRARCTLFSSHLRLGIAFQNYATFTALFLQVPQVEFTFLDIGKKGITEDCACLDHFKTV